MPPRLNCRIASQGPIYPEAQNRAYQSFPTVTRVGKGHVLIAWRDGRVDREWQDYRDSHGDRGDIFVADSFDEGRTFEEPRMVVDHRWEETSEFDAIATGLGHNQVLLITRTHEDERYDSYWSISRDGGQNFMDRRVLRTDGLGIEHTRDDRFIVACYSHALPDPDGRGYLLPLYAVIGPDVQAVGLGRLDTAESMLHKHGWIWEGAYRSCYFNEFAALPLEDGRLMAIIREEPCISGLYRSYSQDFGRTWTEPEPIGIFGEAPYLLQLQDKRIMAVFRGLGNTRGEANYLGLTVTDDNGATWSEPYKLETYDGGRFHGGYGDLLLTESGQILAIYYIAQSGGLPILHKALFNI